MALWGWVLVHREGLAVEPVFEELFGFVGAGVVLDPHGHRHCLVVGQATPCVVALGRDELAGGEVVRTKDMTIRSSDDGAHVHFSRYAKVRM